MRYGAIPIVVECSDNNSERSLQLVRYGAIPIVLEAVELGNDHWTRITLGSVFGKLKTGLGSPLWLGPLNGSLEP